MARPVLHSDERRSERYNLRFTPAELATLEEHAAVCGQSVSTFLRDRCLGYRPSVAAAGNAASVAAADRLGRRLAEIGNVVNQVARAAHTDRSAPDGWERLPAEIDRLLNEFERTLAALAGAAD